MRRYQKFLTSSPSFIGLGISDLVVVCIGLNLSLFFRWESNTSLVFIIGLIGLVKLIKKYVDVTGLILGFRRTESIRWSELKEKRDEN